MDRTFQQIAGQFENKALLELALTHSSYGNETLKHLPKAQQNNERMEYLGDAVLQLATSQWLFQNFKESDEGELSRRRAELVKTDVLARLAGDFQLDKFIRLGRGESSRRHQLSASVLAGAFEATVGALFLDKGFAAVYQWIGLIFQAEVLDQEFQDYKTQLQEIAQSMKAKQGYREQAIQYQFLGESGPDHQKQFDVEVFILGISQGRGSGKSKKQAEQAAAKEALLRLSGRISL